MLISCVVIVQLICAFVLEYAKSRFSHDVAKTKFLIYVKLVLVKKETISNAY